MYKLSNIKVCSWIYSSIKNNIFSKGSSKGNFLLYPSVANADLPYLPNKKIVSSVWFFYSAKKLAPHRSILEVFKNQRETIAFQEAPNKPVIKNYKVNFNESFTTPEPYKLLIVIV